MGGGVDRLRRMTTKQKIELRLSKVRSRLNEIAGLEGDAFTPEVKEEADILGKEYGDLEIRHRAAILSESAEEAGGRSDVCRRIAGFGRRRAAFPAWTGIPGRLPEPALAGVGITGAAAELASALGVPSVGPGGGVNVPWRLLEDRAFTTTAAK